MAVNEQIRNRASVTLTATLVVAAVAVGAASVHREFLRPAPRNPAAAADNRVTYDEGWYGYLRHGVVIGDSSAPIKVIEFLDFECPFCRQLHGRLSVLRTRFRDTVAVVLVHFPLRQHRFALPAAHAAECAAEQNRFAGFADVLFTKQDSLGLKSWGEYAVEARLPDVARFERCNRAPTSSPRIDSGLAAGSRAGVRGTPTVLVNGWRLPGTPDSATLNNAVVSVLAGRAPLGR